jgi:hypothetical protein
MRKKMYITCILLGIALVTMGAANSCQAPMDATGDYNGTWSINIKEGETVVDTVECGAIAMNFTQDVTLAPPDNLKVTGTITPETYACFADAGWPEKLIPEPEPIEVSGTMGSSDGRLLLFSGGLGTGTGAIFIVDGMGVADSAGTEDIPPMRTYSGKWGFAVSVVFLGTLGVDGTFNVTRE